ncbi:MAG: carboxypeptidase regulatory-like domain-containing protein, partial [Gammaproteobacteria bacterium]|nr:carboxypeptidase regulatory-like domain-containing protein [Gammaproteobacteria bacterium]
MRRTKIGSLFSLGFVLLLSGCQGNESTPTLPYEGEVKINGKPISGATVVFHSKKTGDQEVSPSGTTDATGKFRLTSNKEFDGAPAGDYAVTITWF